MNGISHITDPSIDPTVALIEENAIRKVLNYYCFAVDFKQWELFDNVFTSDAALDYGPALGKFSGPKELGAILDKFQTHVNAQHNITTQVITLLPAKDADAKPTEAVALTYCFAPHYGTGAKAGQHAFAYVMYDDKLAKEGGMWKIKERTMTFPGPVSGDMSIFAP